MMATVHATAPHTLSTPSMYFSRRRSSTPVVTFQEPSRPSIELHKPVWVVDYDAYEAIVTGEIEINTSVFPRNAPFAIGVELKTPNGASEWNHDGPSSKPGSFIQLGQRLTVDESAYTTITLSIPRSLLPASQHGRVFTLTCCAFLLSDPRVKTELTAARFMVVRRAPVTEVVVQLAPSDSESESGKHASVPRTWRRVGGAWGKVARW